MMLDIKAAIAIHMRWRSTFSLCIACRELLSSDEMERIHHEDRCMLGRWLASAETLPYRPLNEFQEVQRQHHAFHLEMARLARLIQVSQYEGAEVLLRPGSNFQRVSQELASSLIVLGRAAAKASALTQLER